MSDVKIVWGLNDFSFADSIETKEEREKRLKEEELQKQMEELGKQGVEQTDQEQPEYKPFSKINTEEDFENTVAASNVFKAPEPSTKRKIQYGIAQEPTVLRNVLTLSSAGIESLFSEKTYSEIAREKEARRQQNILDDFPDFAGREEDAAVIAGRMMVGLADPVTFIITPLKLAKFGKMAQVAGGAGIGATDVALREEALYGEVDPLSVGIGTVLGGTSAGIGVGIQSRFRKTKNDAIKERQNAYTKDGVKKIPTVIGPTPRLKTLKTPEEIQKFEKIGDRVAAKAQTEIKNIVRYSENYGSLSIQLADINSDIRILTDNLIGLTKKATKVEDLSQLGLKPKLPAALKKLKPTYDYKNATYRLDFDSEIDKALFIVSNPKLKHKDDAKFIKALRELYTAENKITPSITELRNMGRQLRATLPKKTQDITNRSQPIKINKFNDLQSDILPSKRQLNAYKASLDKATAEKELTKLQTLESKLQAKRDKISTQDLPEEYLEVAIKTWDELAKGNALSTNVVRGLVYETTRPLLGGISGGMLGVIADPNIQNAEDLFSQRMLGYVMAGALLGQWQKSIQRNTYNIRESKYNKFLRVFGEEKDKVLKRSLNTVLKEATAGTHSSWMQASIDPIRKLGAKLYKVQGAELNMNAKLPQMPVEQASSVMENYYIRRSYDIMKNVDHDDLIAAGRILNNKGINPDAKYKFIKEGDLENAEAIRVAAELDGLQKGYLKYAQEAGVPIQVEEIYGLTQMINPQMVFNRLDYTVGEIETALQIQNKNQKGKIRFGKEFVPTPKDKMTESALQYLEGSTQVRRENIWKYAADSDTVTMVNRLNNEEDFVMQAAKNLSKERMIFDPEARAYLMSKEIFIDDPRLTFNSLVKKNTKIVEFTRKFGSQGEGIKEVFAQNRAWYIDQAKKNNMLLPDGSLPISLERELSRSNKKVTDSLDAFFGVYGQVDDASVDTAQRAAVLYGQSILATTKLEKVVVPSIGDLTQVMQNSGFKPWAKAEWKQIMKLVTGGNNVRYSEEMGQNLYTKETGTLAKVTGWNRNAQFDESTFSSEMSGMFIEAPNLAPTEFMRRFFELVQLGRITRHAREVAYDAGVMNLYDMGSKLSRKVGKTGKPKITPAMKKKLSQLDVDAEEAMYVASFKNADEAWETDRVARRIMQRAGISAADRDALIPTVGNRRLFSQSQNPFVRLAGSFLSWAQAKSTQTNSLISRLEHGDHALALRMVAVMPIYAAVNQLRMNLMSSEKYKHPYTYDQVSVKKGAEAMLFSGQWLPWYFDKLFNSARNMAGDPRPLDSVYPIISLIDDLAKMAMYGVTGQGAEAGVQAVETLVPFGEDIVGQTDLKAVLKRRRDNRKLRNRRRGRGRDERFPFEDEGEDRQRTYFEGGKVSKDFPVPNVKEEPSEMINKTTGQPYEAPYVRQQYVHGALVKTIDNLPSAVKTYGHKVLLGNRDPITSENFKPEQMEMINNVLTDNIRAGIEKGDYFLNPKGELKSIKNQDDMFGSKSTEDQGYFINFSGSEVDEDVWMVLGKSSLSIDKKEPKYGIIDKYDFSYTHAGNPTARGLNIKNIKEYRKLGEKRVKQKKLMEQFGDKNPESKQSERPLDDLRKDPKSVILPYAERYAAGQLPDKQAARDLSLLEGREVKPESVDIEISSVLNFTKEEWKELMDRAEENRRKIKERVKKQNKKTS